MAEEECSAATRDEGDVA